MDYYCGSMIDRKEFARIRREMEKADEDREKTIKQSRELIRLSKKVIYAVHRNDPEADALVKLMIKKGKQLKPSTEGHYRTAMQEFVEAASFYEVVRNNHLPEGLGVSSECYLLGLCDLTGELMRKAINCAIKDENSEALRIKNAISEIYDEMMMFDFRNSELRRKFDGIKYNLKKAEDLALQIKLKK